MTGHPRLRGPAVCIVSLALWHFIKVSPTGARKFAKAQPNACVKLGPNKALPFPGA